MKKLNSFILNYRGVKEEREGRGGSDPNKWNQGNMTLT